MNIQTLNLVHAYFRFAGLLVAAVSLLYLMERRWHILARFFSEESTALNLAIIRIAVLLGLWNEIDLSKILIFANLDEKLLSPPKGWDTLATLLPRSPHLVEVTYLIFVVSACLALVGLSGRWSCLVAAASSTYLLTVPQLFGKVHHYHHLVLFCFLVALFPSFDTLSADSIFRAIRLADKGILLRTTRSRGYAIAINCILISMGMIYFFPGAWKVCRAWPYWFSSQNMGYLIYLRLLELKPTVLQVAALRTPWFLGVSSYATIVFELGMLFLILSKRHRTAAAVIGLGFHNMTGALMGIWFVGLQICYVALIDWSDLLETIARKLRLTSIAVVYDPHCRLCRRTIGILTSLDWLNALVTIPNTSLDELPDSIRTTHGAVLNQMFMALDEENRPNFGYAAYELIAGRIVLLWPMRPFLGIPPIRRVGEKVYACIAESRTCSPLDKTAAKGEIVVKGDVSRVARLFAYSVLAGMFATGCVRVVNTWPISCYPTFDGPRTDYISELSIQAVTPADQSVDATLSYDPQMGRFMDTERWDGLVQQYLRKKMTRESAAALIRLWMAQHRYEALRSATLSIDTYLLDPTTQTAKFVRRTSVDSFSAGDGF
jgi:predicted DCC family thiol-disulfide oxidoreductase YuxK